MTDFTRGTLDADAMIRRMQCDGLFKSASSSSQVTLVCAALVLVAGYVVSTDTSRLVAWCSIVLVLILASHLAGYLYKRKNDLVSIQGWLLVKGGLLLLLGIAWSCLGWIGTSGNETLTVLLELIILGALFSHITLLSPLLTAGLVMVVPPMLTLAGLHLLQSTASSYLLGGVFLCFLVVMVKLAMFTGRLQQQNYREEYQVARLVNILHAEKAQLEEKVEERTGQLVTLNSALSRELQNKSDFLAMLSHEMRTPLNGILATLDLLMTLDLEPQARRLAGISQTSGKQLLTLISDVLDLARLQSGLAIHDQVATDVSGLLQEVRETFDAMAKAKGIELRVALPDAPAWLRVDAASLTQVLNNLVSNAVRFTSEGTVTVSLTLVEQKPHQVQARFAVIDTGIGISRSETSHVFEPFYRSGEHSGTVDGTGLGLSICRLLVSSLGGTLQLESSPGKGSVFSFELVLDREEREETGNVAPGSGEASGEMCLPDTRVLVVEDNMVNREVLLGLLTAMGCEAEAAENGEAGLAKFLEAEFDLVLMDLQMPVMDGFEATRKIRAHEAENDRRQTPVVAVTANALVETREKSKQVGMNGFITKPVYQEKLFESIQEVLSRANK